MPVLYGVTFPEPIMGLPRAIQKGIPGDKSWEQWPGWSVQVSGNRVIIEQPVIDLGDPNVQGVPPAAREEFDANNKPGADGKKASTMTLLYSVPTSMCVILDIDLDLDAKSSRVKTPTPALLKALAERAKKPPAPPPRPPSAYAGPAPTPMRPGPVPPGPTRPVTPPPSIIIMDDEDEAPTP